MKASGSLRAQFHHSRDTMLTIVLPRSEYHSSQLLPLSWSTYPSNLSQQRLSLCRIQEDPSTDTLEISARIPFPPNLWSLDSILQTLTGQEVLEKGHKRRDTAGRICAGPEKGAHSINQSVATPSPSHGLHPSTQSPARPAKKHLCSVTLTRIHPQLRST